MNKSENEYGFTLIEIVVALVFIGILVVSILTGYSTNLTSSAHLRNRNIAINLANERVQFLKQYELSATYNRSSSVWTDGSPDSKDENGVRFTITTSLGDTSLFAGDNTIIPIKVDVTWYERGKEQKVSLQTYLFQSY